MDRDLIIHYAFQLNWHLPEEQQQDAIDWLIENTPKDKLALIFPKYSKFCWQNAMKVIEGIGYPNNKPAFPRMLELFQDLNWPGAEEAVVYLQTIETTVITPYIEAAARQAKTEQDDQWLWFLYAVCERLNIERSLFQDSTIFDEMRECYEKD
ncbi:MAG: DUF5071 domain-containing protein [Solibacillus sp.]